jgi:hypothetical protein
MKKVFLLVFLALVGCQTTTDPAAPNKLQQIGAVLQQTGHEMQQNQPPSSTTTCTEAMGTMHCRTTY